MIRFAIKYEGFDFFCLVVGSSGVIASMYFTTASMYGLSKIMPGLGYPAADGLYMQVHLTETLKPKELTEMPT